MPAPDTIAAVATAPGPGAVALLRVSGPDALPLTLRLAGRSAPGQTPAPRVATLVTLTDPDSGEVLDQGLLTWFAGPASYTGEDVVEITTHGGPLASGLVLEALLAAGARQADPGEFTRRAYLNGKLDLLQAEAVLDMVEGRSRALHRVAVHQLERGLSARIDDLRTQLVSVEALLSHHIDFPEEDEPPTPTHVIAERAGAVEAALKALLVNAPEGELLRRGAVVVLAGAPNAGKSSLFNALAGIERALVTEIPGTTRDAVEVEASVGGYPFRLVDTAGLRETDQVVERLGIEVASRYLASADLVLYCRSVEGSTHGDVEGFLERVSGTPVVLVETQVDRMEKGGVGRAGAGSVGAVGAGAGAGAGAAPEMPSQEVSPMASSFVGHVRVSAHTGAGMDRLRALLPDLVFSGVVNASRDTGLLTRERQARGVRTAHAEVSEFRVALENGVPAELASAHLKEAVSALEDVVGVVTQDDVLDVLFRSFCVGK